jgi:23S rRNA (cytidine1920-2'-O)/16S rRNA (cytidine1409-2'-O)-methyltransferase
MRLDQALVERKLCDSRTEAQELIDSGYVYVNGAQVTKRIKQVEVADSLEVTNRRRFVSRGGEKLLGVLEDLYQTEEAIHKALNRKFALDVGSSTGGFTDCLLLHGVSHVDAVDVGSKQLHESLRNDSRITLFENKDIRNFSPSTSYDIVVADLSFISLSSVFDTIISFGTTGTLFILLIKPQFEVGKGNTKKGIVKDKKLVDDILEYYKKIAIISGFKKVDIFPSHIQGGDGNQEYFLYGVLQ